MACWIQPTAVNQTGATGTCSGAFQVDGPSKGLVKFDLSSIPANIQLLNADFSLFQQRYPFTTSTTVGVYAMTQSWTGTADATTNSVNWTTYDGTHSWATPGGDFSSTPASPTPVTLTQGAYSCPSQRCHWNLTTLTGQWLSGATPNDGVAVRDVAGGSTLQINPASFYDATSPTYPYAPELTLTYTSWTGDRSFYTETSSPLTDQLSAGVNVANGNLLLDEHNVTIPGTGLDLPLDEYYNNLSTGSGSFGNGWTLGTAPDVGLQINSDGSVSLVGPTGYCVPFVKNADGSFTAPAGIDSTLVQNSDGTYTLSVHDTGESYTFSAGGFLTAEKDPSGNTITARYTNNMITSLTDTQGRQVTFSYGSSVSPNLVTQITDSAGRTYGFTYDSSKNLTAYTDPNGKVAHYAYDSGDNLNQITDPNGNVTTIAYDSYRRVTSMTQVTNQPTAGAGATTTYTYNSGNTVVTDPNNHATTYTYDTYGRTLTTKDPLGNVSTAAWNTDDQVTQAKTPNGGSTAVTYNSNNEPTQVVDPMGATTAGSYTNSSDPYLATSLTDPTGHVTTQQYSSQDLPTVSRDPLGNTTTASYNANGTTSSIITPRNNTTSYTYNTAGQATSVTAPSGSGLGMPTQTYNSYGLVVTSTDGDGNVTTYTYDNLGRETGSTTVNAKGTGTVAFADVYDADGNLLAMTDSSGTTSYTYNALNQQVSEQVPGGMTNTYTYANVGNMLTAHDGATGHTTIYTYDAGDRVATVKDFQGNVTQFSYDKDGNQTAETLPSGDTESLTYDASDNLTGISAATSGGTILSSDQYQYTDPYSGQYVGRVMTKTDTGRDQFSYSYDADGNTTEMVETSPSGTTVHDWKYTYDADGNLSTFTFDGAAQTLGYNSADELTSESGSSGTTTFSYNGDGNETSSSNGVTYTWDAASQMNTIALANGTNIAVGYSGPWWNPATYGMTSFTYDDTGETSQTTGSSTTSFTNLPNGTPLSETNSSGTYWYIDDGEGDVAALINGLGGVANTYSYGPTGSTLSQTGTTSNPLTFQYWNTDPTTGDYITGTGISTNLSQTLGFGGGAVTWGGGANPSCTFTDESIIPEAECAGAGAGDGEFEPDPGCDESPLSAGGFTGVTSGSFQEMACGEPIKVNQMEREVQQGRAPRQVQRVEWSTEDSRRVAHVHFKGTRASLYSTGNWRHFDPGFTLQNSTIEWLRGWGFNI
jgi:YD repeat-containing protein